MSVKFETREQWLEAAVRRLSRLFKDINIEVPDVRVSVGWPSKGGLSNTNPTIGQCWKGSVATDGVPQIFISPTLGEVTLNVLATLVHEMIHAYDDCESGHKGEFARVARLIGLEGKLTATSVSADSDLGLRLQGVIKDLGEFPHAALVASEMQKQRKPQATRMLKIGPRECCGFIARTTAKWLDQEGFPQCPHGVDMELL